MVIRPSNPEPSRRVPAPGTDASPTPPAIQRETKSADRSVPATAGPDRVVVSSAADALLGRVGGTSPEVGALSSERAQAVLARIRTGHYERPEVLDQVARKLQAELDGPASEA